MNILTERVTAKVDQDEFVVFLIGMRVNKPWKVHKWLPVARAIELDRTKWGELHPWVQRDGFWDGVAMIFTPRTLEEVDVTMRLIVDAYNLVTGAGPDPLASD